MHSTAVSSEAWAKFRDWASVAGRGRLLLSGSVAHASLKTAVRAYTGSEVVRSCVSPCMGKFTNDVLIKAGADLLLREVA